MNWYKISQKWSPAEEDANRLYDKWKDDIFLRDIRLQIVSAFGIKDDRIKKIDVKPFFDDNNLARIAVHVYATYMEESYRSKIEGSLADAVGKIEKMAGASVDLSISYIYEEILKKHKDIMWSNTDEDIAAATGIPFSFIREIRQPAPHGKSWVETIDWRKSDKDIAIDTGRTTNSIALYRHYHAPKEYGREYHEWLKKWIKNKRGLEEVIRRTENYRGEAAADKLRRLVNTFREVYPDK